MTTGQNQIRTYYLEMLNKDDLVTCSIPEDFSIIEVVNKQPEFNQFLYAFVGKQWNWSDKLSWSLQSWQQYLRENNVRTWVAYVDGAIAGYYELSMQNAGNVELAYFGLTQSFIGKGYGGPLLSHALESAWSMRETKRVWVHTCDLDHPHALSNYKNRGFNHFKTDIE